MKKRAIRWTLMMAISLVPLLFIFSGCQSKSDLPVYSWQEDERGNFVVMEEVRYNAVYYYWRSRWGYVGQEPKTPIAYADGYQTIYSISDEPQPDVFVTKPTHYTFGPLMQYLLVRDGVELKEPDCDSIGRITVEYLSSEDGGTILTTDDSAIIELFFTPDHSGEKIPYQPLEGEKHKSVVFLLHHKDYPDLAYGISGGYYPQSKCLDIEKKEEDGGDSCRLPKDLNEALTSQIAVK